MKFWRKTAAALLAGLFILGFWVTGALAQPPADGQNLKHRAGNELKERVKSEIKLQKRFFLDMPGHWSDEYVTPLALEGVVNGYEDGTFRPEDDVSKAEAVTMIVRLLNASDNGEAAVNAEKIPPSLGAKIPFWAVPCVALAWDMGILSDSDLGGFDAGAPAGRWEVAVWLARALGLKPAEGAALDSCFADLKELPDRAVPLIEAARRLGIITGYPDGTFRPHSGIKRGEMAALLSRVIHMSAKALNFQPVFGTIREINTGENPSVVMNVYGQRNLSWVFGEFKPGEAKEVTLALDDDAVVFLNGKRASLEELSPGCRAVVFVQRDGQAVLIRAKEVRRTEGRGEGETKGWYLNGTD